VLEVIKVGLPSSR
jgi:hypothetical protein